VFFAIGAGIIPRVSIQSKDTMPEANLDERQQRIFVDACRLMKIEPSLETTTHLVGHCIREIESALRDLLVPLGRDPQPPPPNDPRALPKSALRGNGNVATVTAESTTKGIDRVTRCD
jgi:hypothetical protein